MELKLWSALIEWMCGGAIYWVGKDWKKQKDNPDFLWAP